jgi:hypothetical protein
LATDLADFHGALAHHQSQQSAFLLDACAGDDALCHEVASLLDQQKDTEGFLEVPRLRWR